MRDIDINDIISNLAFGGSLDDALTISDDRIWEPRPGTQTKVYDCQADVIGYGGEAGGGKTDSVYGISYYKHKRSIIFRAEYSQMDNQIIRRGGEIFTDEIARWVGQHRRSWFFHKGGQLTLGALKNVNDYARYQGSSWDAMFFDEAPNIRQSEVTSVMGWNRSDNPEQRCQAYFYFNPPSTAEGNWIIEFFAPWIDSSHESPAEEGEWRWFVTIEGKSIEVPNGDPYSHKGQTLFPRSRTFFRSRLDENPSYGQEYKSILSSLPYPLNQQLLHGDFDVGALDDAWQLFDGRLITQAFERWEQRNPPLSELSSIGVDVARGGRGRTVIAKRYGNWIAPLIEIPGAETPTGGDVADIVLEHLGDSNARVHIDAIGVGASPYDALVEAGVDVYGVNFGEKSEYTDRTGIYPMSNFRSEVFWQVKELMEFGDPAYIALPRDNGLRREMATIRFSVPVGRILLEDKAKIMERIGTSTDKADAVALACMGVY